MIRSDKEFNFVCFVLNNSILIKWKQKKNLNKSVFVIVADCYL
jgi:hypothetical protein